MQPRLANIPRKDMIFSAWASGEIGIHARLRILCRKAWGFKSPLAHQVFGLDLSDKSDESDTKLLSDPLEQHGREIALAGVGQDHHDGLARELG